MADQSTPQLIQPEDLFRLRFLQGARLSPDGKWAVYGLTDIDRAKDEETVSIWLLSLESGLAHRLTSGSARDTNARWSPDGTEIAFLSTRDGAPQVYVIPAFGGEARKLTSAPLGVGMGPLWSPDGREIAFTSRPVDAKPRDPKAPYRVTRPLYRLDGLGYVEDAIQDIFVVPAAGGEAKPLAQSDYQKTPLAWSPDGEEMLFAAALFPDSGDVLSRLRIANRKGEIRDLLSGSGFFSMAAFTPDGSKIVFSATRPGAPEGAKVDLWVVDRAGGEPECRTSNLKEGVGGMLQRDAPGISPTGGARIVVAADGTTAYVQVQSGGTIRIERIALSGPELCVPVLTGDRACYLLDADERRILFGVSTLNEPGDLYLASPDGSGERRLTRVNEPFLSGLHMAETEHLRFAGSDGVDVEGWFIRPPVGRAPYPTVLYTHGGPHGAFGNAFHFEFQMLAAAGFGVLLVNYSGSAGYGNAFGTRLVGQWGNYDYRDSMAGVDYAIARGLADPDRLGCAGLSYGGYMSCWIVGQTDRFKASVPENPLTNLVSRFGTIDIGPVHGVRELGGTPWDSPDVYRRSSPITYAFKCKTPTLLIQGEADYRCIAEQAEQFYAVLKANRCTVEMLRLPNMSHSGSINGPLFVRRAQNEALLDWMKRYVLGQPEAPR